jgi:thiamine-phosphate pyrophosphorylase
VKPLSQCRLYTFVDAAYLAGRSPECIAEQLCQGGSDLIQLRAKDSSADEARRIAERVLPITNGAGVGLVINDFPEIAQSIGAPVCHLGQEDFFESGHTHRTACPALCGPIKFGLSSHSPAQAVRAVGAGADYVAVGPVFKTGTKPSAEPVTLELVRWAALNLRLPWFAIGGINLENLDSVLEAGARRICVVSAILNASDLASTCRRFKERLDSFDPESGHGA